MFDRRINRQVLISGLTPLETTRELVFSARCQSVVFVVFKDGICTVHGPWGQSPAYETCESLAIDSGATLAAYRVRHRHKCFISVNREAHPDFSWVSDPKVSPDGKIVAYFGEPILGNRERGLDEIALVINGATQEAFHRSGHIAFTPSGKFFYSAQYGDAQYINFAEKRLGPFDTVYQPILIGDTNDVCFWVRNGNKWSIFKNADVIDKGDDGTPDRRVGWSEDGKSIAYWIKHNNQRFVGVNGHLKPALGEPLRYVGGPVMGKSGNVGYCVRLKDSVCAVVNEQPGEPFENVGQIVFSPDENNYAYMAQRDGKLFLVRDGKRGRPYEPMWSKVFEEPGTLDNMPSFNPMGKDVACVIRQGSRQYVSVNDELIGPFIWICGAPRFAACGTLVFGAVSLEKQEFVFVGKEKYGPFMRVWSPLTCAYYSSIWSPCFADGKLVFAARDGTTLSLYTLPVP